MNKKIFLIAIIALMLSMSVVSANEFKNKQFDGFSINVPKNSNFAEQTTEGENIGEIGIYKLYLDENNQIAIEYLETPVISGENIDFFYQQMFCSLNPNLDNCYETQIGNMKVLYPMKKSEENFAMVGVNDGNQTVVIGGSDVSLIKEMGKSVEFN